MVGLQRRPGGSIAIMTNTTVVRARIDERTKRHAAALKNIGLTVSDAFPLSR